MKLLVLGPGTSIHLRRWLRALVGRGIDVCFVTAHPSPEVLSIPGLMDYVVLPFRSEANYFWNALELRRICQRLRPDILHAHYASGYGTTAALAAHPVTILSVWGSDVFEFPAQSRFKGCLVRWNLRRASRVFSTSHAMADQVMRLVPDLRSEVVVTPFGIDCEVFKFTERHDNLEIVIGSVKSLAPVYGMDVLVRAFGILRQRLLEAAAPLAARIRLRIWGDGPDRMLLEKLIVDLELQDVVRLMGQIPHEAVPDALSELDVFVASSRAESFGVAVLEASACGLPVIASRVGGLPEVVEDGQSGYLIAPDDPFALCDALECLVRDRTLRSEMGRSGADMVRRRYAWEHCVDRMLDGYATVLATPKLP